MSNLRRGANKPHLPKSRINTIMKSSSEADKISKEASFMMTKATELFIRVLAQEGYKLTSNGKKLDYKHLAQVVNIEDRYEFVRDIMPKKITVLEYKQIMARKRKANRSSSDEDEEEEEEEEEETSSSAASTSSEGKQVNSSSKGKTQEEPPTQVDSSSENNSDNEN